MTQVGSLNGREREILLVEFTAPKGDFFLSFRIEQANPTVILVMLENPAIHCKLQFRQEREGEHKNWDLQKVAPGHDPGDLRLVYDQAVGLLMDRMDELPQRRIRRHEQRVVERAFQLAHPLP